MKSFKQLIKEDIKSKLKKFKNLSSRDKKQVEDFFKKNNQAEKEFNYKANKDWDLTDFQIIFHTPSKTKIKKQVKSSGIRGLRKDIDYADVSYMFDYYKAYMPLNYESSKHIASNYIGKCTGEWCTAYQKSNAYWKSHTKSSLFIYLISNDGFSKFAIQSRGNTLIIWDKDNNNVRKIPHINIHNVLRKNKKKIESIWEDLFSKDKHWIDDADTQNAIYDIIDKKMIIWKDGIWYGGEWEDGEWKGGIWKSGIWKSGIWYDGEWKYGEWKYGVWVDGNWEDGEWEGGTWKGGEWRGGIWYDGEWEDGGWYDGTWKGGTWYDGIWYDGEWQYGVWVDGNWEDGNWEDGGWYDGTWHDGTWHDGTWEDGIWVKGIWQRGEWKGGEWRGGIWKSGIWYGGEWKGGEWRGGYDKDGKYHERGDSPDKWDK